MTDPAPSACVLSWIESCETTVNAHLNERNWRSRQSSAIVLRDIAGIFKLLQKRLSQLEEAMQNESTVTQNVTLDSEKTERLVDRISEATRDIALIAAQIPVVRVGDIVLKAQILREFVGHETDDAADQLAASLCRDIVLHSSK